jgi:hypothetical protein
MHERKRREDTRHEMKFLPARYYNEDVEIMAEVAAEQSEQQAKYCERGDSDLQATTKIANVTFLTGDSM